MDITSVAGAVLRRWYVFLVVIALAGYAAVGAWQQARPTYTSTIVVTVLPSTSLLGVRAQSDAGESSLGNPFGIGANSILASLLADEINTGGIALPDDAAGAFLAVQAATQDLRSFFTIQSVADSPQAALSALTAAVDQGPQVLADIQLSSGAPADQLYTVLPTRSPTAPYADYPDRARLAVGIGLGGFLLATLLCVLVDSVVAHRRRRTASGESAPEQDDPGTWGPTGTGRHHPVGVEEQHGLPRVPPSPNPAHGIVEDGRAET